MSIDRNSSLELPARLGAPTRGTGRDGAEPCIHLPGILKGVTSNTILRNYVGCSLAGVTTTKVVKGKLASERVGRWVQSKGKE
jgi:hypothetical protein